MNNVSRKGIIFVVSAPSGTGKSTLCNNLRLGRDFVFSVSCTTRSPRAGEEDGVDYRFLSKEDFLRRVEAGDFLEHAQVHRDHYYGTLRQDVLSQINKGMDILLDIDVQGARQIRNSTDPVIREALVDVFIMPPTMEELEKRLRKRGTESEEQIQRRLQTAPDEMKVWPEYRYTIISESMEEDLQKFRSLMKAERYKSHRLLGVS